MELQSQYQLHLERVSRSFAFCIPLLEPELRHQVSLAYLLFRVVDTIEDSVWIDSSVQTQQFREFIEFIQNVPNEEVVRIWISRFPESLPHEEKLLLADTVRFLEDLHTLPRELSKILQESLIEMIQGMAHFATRADHRLQTMQELNQYCFFVAGLVGELLTALVLKRPLTRNDGALLLKSHHFGLFLQKINILKDQAKDEQEERFFVPKRQLVLKV